ncbi:FtsW/RodA/SpoVE family cell cycle protein [Sulfurihydrogenibium azorense]|uniref:FtsW/RodA/SpoVE family cell cycle protein n=1 Tax=Sulfurihydrogenibium azorense TaxID=309806 RepID=UPI003918E88E
MVRSFYIDWPLFISFALLVIIGLVAVYSATYTATSDPFYYLKRHIFALIIATVGLIVAFSIPIDFWKKNAYFIFIISVILLVVVLVLPPDGTGTKRWINLGLFKFQPSEFVKFATVLFIAKYLSRKEDKLDSFEPVVVIYAIVGLVGLLVAVEPHKGAALFLFILTGLLLFSSPLKVRYVLTPVFFILPFFIMFFILKSNYAFSRLKGWLNPDPSSKEGYQPYQAMLSFAKGGPLGEGIGMGTQKLNYLPEIHTDYIFSLIGEETGLIGSSLVMFLFFVILYRGVKISLEKDDLFTQVLGLGVVYIITLNAVFHMFVNLNIFPSTGFTLTFISYGGSSLIMSFIYIGILLRISKEPVKVSFVKRVK